MIKSTIDNVKKLTPEQPTALYEIEMWRTKSAMLSTLQQQLSRREVEIVKKRFKKYNEELQPATVMDFEGQMKELNKKYNEAKDNGKHRQPSAPDSVPRRRGGRPVPWESEI